MAVVLSLVLSFAVSNAVHPGLGANEKLALCNCGTRKADFIEIVFVQDLELRAGLDYESCALFAQTGRRAVHHRSLESPRRSRWFGVLPILARRALCKLRVTKALRRCQHLYSKPSSERCLWVSLILNNLLWACPALRRCIPM